MNRLHHDVISGLQALADYAASLRLADLPAEVIERSCWVLRDTIGVIIGGMQEPEPRALAIDAAKRAPGPVPLMGQAGSVSAEWAALVHGTAGTTLEMDEGHAYALGHAAIHAVAAGLAVAVEQRQSGPDALASIVAAYEVAARVGVASRLRPGVHPFGAWGVLGAATAGARAYSSDGDTLAGTLDLAAAYAINPSFGAAFSGATVRNTYAGVVNMLGLLAADFYRLGFRGEQGGPAVSFGQILGESFDPAPLTEGLGTHFEIMRGYFKPYSACRYSHAAIDAALRLRDMDGFDVTQIERVTVETYALAATLADPQPQNALGARFSIPYVTAGVLLYGQGGPELFQPERLNDETLRRMAQLVEVREDPELTAMLPAKRAARVTVYLRDGSTHHAMVSGSAGDPDQPMSAEALAQKFLGLTVPVLGIETAVQLWDQLGVFETLEDVSDLLSRLNTASGTKDSPNDDEEVSHRREP